MKLASINYRKLIVVAVSLLLVLLLFRLFWYGSLSVPASGDVAYDIVANDSLVLQGQSARVRPGKYTIVVRGPRLKKSSMNYYVWPFTKKTIETDQKPMDNQELIAYITGAEKESLQLYAVNFFENETWLVAFAGPVGEVGDIAPTIAKYQSGDWVVVDGGTGVEFADDVSLPKSVRAYFKDKS